MIVTGPRGLQSIAGGGSFATVHGFFYDPDVPESRECYDVIVRLLGKHFGKR
jgi:hypothetical protein